MLTLYTFGDSILDCGHYNTFGITPGQLLIRNDDRLFPEFRGQGLASTVGETRLEHRARDGSTIQELPAQAHGIHAEREAIAVLTIGGNDLIMGLAIDSGPGIRAFTESLDRFLNDLPIRLVFLGNVYDPSFGDDSDNFLGIDPGMARANHRMVNSAIAGLASKYGALVDLHAHFLTGDPSWYTRTIEPSLLGASEVRRAFLAQILAWHARNA
jgi:acyl-CoA thioesterase-1